MITLPSCSGSEVWSEKVPPPITIIYGQPKIGKTTFACGAPKPIVIQTERGAAGLPVPKIPPSPCDSWGQLLECVSALLKDDHDRKTVILDTVDLAETLCMDHVCRKMFDNDWDKYAAYGRGAVATAGEFRRLVNGLTMLRDNLEMNVIVIAHEGLQRGANMMGDDYQKFGGKLDKRTWATIRDWADQVLHATMKMHVTGGDHDRRTGKQTSLAKVKGSGDERVLISHGSPARDAGCRAGYELPKEINLSWEEYHQHMKEKINAED